MELLKLTLPDKKQCIKLNTKYYQQFNAYQLELLSKQSELYFYRAALKQSLTFFEDKLGKTNKYVCDFRIQIKVVDADINTLRQIIEKEGITDMLLKHLASNV